jgi:hypothetical protein
MFRPNGDYLPQGVAAQKTNIDIFTDVTTSNLAYDNEHNPGTKHLPALHKLPSTLKPACRIICLKITKEHLQQSTEQINVLWETNLIDVVKREYQLITSTNLVTNVSQWYHKNVKC